MKTKGQIIESLRYWHDQGNEHVSEANLYSRLVDVTDSDYFESIEALVSEGSISRCDDGYVLHVNDVNDASETTEPETEAEPAPTPTLLATRVKVRVNRKRRFRTLQDKAWVQNKDWRTPRTNEIGLFEKPNGGYWRQSCVEITDVDGAVKRVLFTEHLDADEQLLATPSPSYGHTCQTGSTYHGKHSVNWKPETLALRDVVEQVLRKGWSVAPGLFKPTAESPSHRTFDSLVTTNLVFFDGDVWTAENPAPQSYAELIERYPAIPTRFFWVGESISSRSSLKPEMRFRLGMFLPEGFTNEEKKAWEIMVADIRATFPFIDDEVGTDMARLSYGNARQDCLSVFHPEARVERREVRRWKALAAAEHRKEEAAKAKQERLAKQRETARRNKTRHAPIANGNSPMQALKDTPITVLLNEMGLTHIRGNEWLYERSHAEVRSAVVAGTVLMPFSSSLQAELPVDKEGINIYRAFIYMKFNVDIKAIKGDSVAFAKLFKQLADAGYGHWKESIWIDKRLYPTIARDFQSLGYATPPRPTQAAQKEGIIGYLFEDIDCPEKPGCRASYTIALTERTDTSPANVKRGWKCQCYTDYVPFGTRRIKK